MLIHLTRALDIMGQPYDISNLGKRRLYGQPFYDPFQQRLYSHPFYDLRKTIKTTSVL